MLTKTKPEDARYLWQQAQHDAELRFHFYEYLAQRKFNNGDDRAEETQVVGRRPFAAAEGTTR